MDSQLGQKVAMAAVSIRRMRQDQRSLAAASRSLELPIPTATPPHGSVHPPYPRTAAAAPGGSLQQYDSSVYLYLPSPMNRPILYRISQLLLFPAALCL
jgi:hypothetical protein